MSNKAVENQLRYWRNTLADAARSEILVDKLRSIRDVRVNLQAGLVDSTQTAQLFAWLEGQLNEPKGLSSPADPAWEVLEQTAVLLSPFRVSPVPEYTRLSGETGIFYPFWIRAILFNTGRLQVDEDSFPYIPRVHLEPQVNEQLNYLFSSIDAVDRGFAKPFVASPHWSDYWAYVKQTFLAITGQPIETYQQANYAVTYEPTLVVNETLTGAADGIIELYDSVLRSPPFPSLLTRLTNRPYQPLKAVLSGEELVAASATQLGQMGYEYALSSSQRKSLYQLNQLEEGDILAVNGPPGTGKTTLLQSIVASQVVKQAVEGKEPAIILACSTNNQAVTNIIDSFSKIKPKPGGLYERWLPGLKGFGLYLPSEAKQVGPEVMHLKRKNGGWLRDIENRDYLAQAERFYVDRFAAYATLGNQSVEQIVDYLQKQLKAGQQQLQDGVQRWQQYATVPGLVTQLGPPPGIAWPSLEQLSTWETHLKALEERISTYLDNESFWINLLAFLKPIKEKRAMRLKQFFRDCPLNAAAVNVYNLSSVHAFFDHKFGLINQIRQLTNAWSDWKQAHQIQGNPPLDDTGLRAAEQARRPYFYDELETGLKYNLFYLAIHYWEGRWIMATRRALDENRITKYGIEQSKERWRRFAMLTPCFVSTFYTAPRFFTYSKFVTKTTTGNIYESPPLKAFIDLLIVDEAGQVSPEVGAATFALARRSVVVGDTLQIEPVWNVPQKVDYANLARYGLISSTDDQTAIEDLLNKGFLSSSGSIMKLAQKSSAYQLFPQGDRGMLLTEHRRCFDEIIGYCNTLAYNGLLEPRKGPARDGLFPAMAFIPTTGDSQTVGSSRGNEEQARQIADWIKQNQTSIIQHYQQQEANLAQQQNRAAQRRDLSSLIGIITPFTGQKQLLRSALQKAGVDTSRLTIGTVHALQGAERPIILFSSTYGENDQGKAYFFDAGVNMLNVGVSRAQEAFIFFGSRTNFEGVGNAPSKQLYRYIQHL